MSNPVFQRPVGRAPISDTYAEHVARNSVNPGTDYIVPIGTNVYAPETGTIAVADISANGAGGRTLAINFDNGWGCDLLHLNSLAVGLYRGQRVKKGQYVGKSGASANGSNYGVGPHLHVSVRPNHKHYSNLDNRDITKYYSNKKVYYCTTGIGKGWWYLVAKGTRTRTRIRTLANFWIRRYGYGGTATLLEILNIQRTGNKDGALWVR